MQINLKKKKRKRKKEKKKKKKKNGTANGLSFYRFWNYAAQIMLYSLGRLLVTVLARDTVSAGHPGTKAIPIEAGQFRALAALVTGFGLWAAVNVPQRLPPGMLQSLRGEKQRRPDTHSNTRCADFFSHLCPTPSVSRVPLTVGSTTTPRILKQHQRKRYRCHSHFFRSITIS